MLTAEVTHNHPEGVKGAQAVAGAICLARNGGSKAEIKGYVEGFYGRLYGSGLALEEMARRKLPEDLREVVRRFYEGIIEKK